MYRVSPFTYLIEGLIGQAVGRSQVQCSPIEVVQLVPPSGQTCGDYMNPYISNAGGYLLNADATDNCNFCHISSSDTFLYSSFNLKYSHHWRSFGLMWAYVLFNVRYPPSSRFAPCTDCRADWLDLCRYVQLPHRWSRRSQEPSRPSQVDYQIITSFCHSPPWTAFSM